MHRKNPFVPNLILLLKLASDWRRNVLLLFIISMTLSCFELGIPFVFKDVVLSLAPKQIDPAQYHETLHALGLLILLYVSKAFVSKMEMSNASRFQAQIMTRLRELVAKMILLKDQKADSHDDGSGSFIGEIATHLTALERFLAVILWETANQFLFLILGAAILIAVDGKLAMIAFIPLPVIILTGFYFFPKSEQALALQNNTTASLNSRFQELVEGREFIRSHHLQPAMLDRFSRFNSAAQRASIDFGKSMASYTPFYELIAGLAMGLLFLAAHYLNTAGKLDFNVLLTFIFFLGYFYRPFFSSVHLAENWQKTWAALKYFHKMMPGFEVENESRQPNTTNICISEWPRSLTARNIEFQYTPDSPLVIKNISFHFENRKKIGIVGDNGAGKSTLLKILTGILEPSRGMLLFGENTSRQDIKLAYLPQKPFLISGSVMDNLLLVNSIHHDHRNDQSDKTIEDIMSFAKRVGLHDSINDFTAGYQTQVGLSGEHLSGGQRQQVSLLRFALQAIHADYCILDEPTTYLDRLVERVFIETILTICQGKTTIIVSHRPEVLELCDEKIKMEHGIILPT